MFLDSIVKKVGEKPGKTLAVFAGIHGNEKAGVLGLDFLSSNLVVEAGTVYFVYANPPAISENVRQVNLNLNRLFHRELVGSDYEFARAQELMDILDSCDALLDLHSYNSQSGEAFVIAENNAKDFFSKLDVSIVAQGFGDMGYGTDDYMYRNGKIGICLECGTSNKFEEFVPFAVKSTKQFLSHYGAISEIIESAQRSQKHYKVKAMHKKYSETFAFSKTFLDFEVLPVDKPFIIDGSVSVTAELGDIIMFPRPDVSIGEEVCIVAKQL